MRKKLKFQSILEYIIILAAITAAVIAAAEKLVKPAINKTFEDATSLITSSTGLLKSNAGRISSIEQ